MLVAVAWPAFVKYPCFIRTHADHLPSQLLQLLLLLLLLLLHVEQCAVAHQHACIARVSGNEGCNSLRCIALLALLVSVLLKQYDKLSNPGPLLSSAMAQTD